MMLTKAQCDEMRAIWTHGDRASTLGGMHATALLDALDEMERDHGALVETARRLIASELGMGEGATADRSRPLSFTMRDGDKEWTASGEVAVGADAPVKVYAEIVLRKRREARPRIERAIKRRLSDGEWAEITKENA